MLEILQCKEELFKSFCPPEKQRMLCSNTDKNSVWPTMFYCGRNLSERDGEWCYEQNKLRTYPGWLNGLYICISSLTLMCVQFQIPRSPNCTVVAVPVPNMTFFTMFKLKILCFPTSQRTYQSTFLVKGKYDQTMFVLVSERWSSRLKYILAFGRIFMASRLANIVCCW